MNEVLFPADTVLRLAWPGALALLFLPWLARRQKASAVDHETSVAIRLPLAGALPKPSNHGPPRTMSGSRCRVSPVIWAAYGFLVLAAARPQSADENAERLASGRDVLLVLDVSASMQTRDLTTGQQMLTRLEAAKQFGSRFLNRRPGDRAGLIVFGSRPYLYTPLTYDLRAVGQAIESMTAGFAGAETALGDAVGLAVGSLQKNESGPGVVRGAVVVLITDGASNRGALSPQQAAWLAAQRGVRIHALGIGAVPDETTLRSLAEQGGGHYARATDGPTVAAFFERIEALEPAAREQAKDGRASHWRDAYPLPLAVAILLLLVSALPIRRMVVAR